MILSPKKRQRIYAPYLEALMRARRETGISQAKLATEVGLSSKYVTLIESGKRIPSLECFLAILAGAGVTRMKAAELVAEVISQFDWPDDEH
jgi:DNA-binding XRE family transcriptional regulator